MTSVPTTPKQLGPNGGAPTTPKKLGPNDKCSCGSGLKVKKCSCAVGSDHTPIAPDCKGQIISGNTQELHASAKEAVQAGNVAKAAHFYTMAIDVLAKSMKRDTNGNASDADLLALNKSSDGLLAELLCGRSNVYLLQKDVAAAMEDAEACTRAAPDYEKGHLRLAVTLESAGVSLVKQLEACERGIENCSHSEVLVKRKWRLKKALAENGDASEAKKIPADAEDKSAVPWSIEQTRRLADDASDPRRTMAAVDLGRAYAAGAHGLQKDLSKAASYLRLGVEGGDVSAQRDLGVLLLEMGQPAEAAEQLKIAAEAGDEEAAGVLQQLVAESNERQKEARAQLEKMAQMGDPRAIKMLEELCA